MWLVKAMYNGYIIYMYLYLKNKTLCICTSLLLIMSMPILCINKIYNNHYINTVGVSYMFIGDFRLLYYNT